MKKTVPLDEVFRRPELVIHAVREGARQAAREHLAHGLPMIVQQNGQIVRMPADEFLRILDQQCPDAGDRAETD